MEILIFSDAHGNRSRMEQALALQPKAPDAVFFLGDGIGRFFALDTGDAARYCVPGNCDFALPGTTLPPEISVTALGGHTVLYTHGHRFSVKSGYGALIRHAAEAGADLVLFGHTHTPYCACLPAGEQVGNTVLARPMWLFNPGSIGESTPPSFGTLTLKDGAVLFSHGTL